MNKVIRDGKVAVLYSRGYGAGWYSWHGVLELVFDPTVVDMVERNTPYDDIEAYCESKWPDHYFGGACGLTIKWIPEGTQFLIEEYDGNESVSLLTDITLLTA